MIKCLITDQTEAHTDRIPSFLVGHIKGIQVWIYRQNIRCFGNLVVLPSEVYVLPWLIRIKIVILVMNCPIKGFQPVLVAEPVGQA